MPSWPSASVASYRVHGPLPREPFKRACRRTKAALGTGRPLKAYLEDLKRQIEAQARDAENDPENATEDPS